MPLCCIFKLDLFNNLFRFRAPFNFPFCHVPSVQFVLRPSSFVLCSWSPYRFSHCQQLTLGTSVENCRRRRRRRCGLSTRWLRCGFQLELDDGSWKLEAGSSIKKLPRLSGPFSLPASARAIKICPQLVKWNMKMAQTDLLRLRYASFCLICPSGPSGPPLPPRESCASASSDTTKLSSAETYGMGMNLALSDRSNTISANFNQIPHFHRPK